MSLKPVIPSDLVDHALRLYGDLGIDIVSRRDQGGRAIDLDVPYDHKVDHILGYRISRHGDEIAVMRLGALSCECLITPEEATGLSTLYEAVAVPAGGLRSLRRGPHREPTRT